LNSLYLARTRQEEEERQSKRERKRGRKREKERGRERERESERRRERKRRRVDDLEDTFPPRACGRKCQNIQDESSADF